MPKPATKKVTLQQSDSTTSDWYYTVVQTTNTTKPRVGAELKEAEVQSLIRAGVSVTIRGAKS